MQKKFYFSFILIFLLSFSAFAKIPEMPAGYSRYMPSPEQCSHIKGGCSDPAHYDFDKDGLEDAFLVAKKDGEDADKLLMVFLKDGKKILYSQPLINCCSYVSQQDISKNGVVSVLSTAMRGGKVFKFRFDKAANDFWLIGVDGEYFGNAVNDYSGKESYNLITGDYWGFCNRWNEKKQKLIKMPELKKKIDISKKIYLHNLNEDYLDEFLYSQNEKYCQ